MDQHVFGTIKGEYVPSLNQLVQAEFWCIPFPRAFVEDLFPHCEIPPFESEVDQQGWVFRERVRPIGTKRAVFDEESRHLSIPFRWPFAPPSPQFLERVFYTTHAQ